MNVWDYNDIVEHSNAYNDVLRHRHTCPKWRKEFCLDCFGGGLTIFSINLLKERDKLIK
jgi:hypothetical protein